MKRIVLVLALLAIIGCSGDTKKKSAPAKPKTETTGSDDVAAPEIKSEFDMSSIPCGTLIGGTKPHFTVQTDNGKILDVVVPDWVWDSYVDRGGEKVGNCGDDVTVTQKDSE